MRGDGSASSVVSRSRHGDGVVRLTAPWMPREIYNACGSTNSSDFPTKGTQVGTFAAGEAFSLK